MAASQTGNVIGRTAELDRLRAALEDVAAGRGRSLLIEGEAGIGKSALLAAALAEARDCEVLRGTCDDLSQRFPLAVMIQTLAVHADSPDPRRAEAALILDRPEKARALSVRMASGDPVVAAVEQLVALVDQLCAAGPLVLSVEDLQWADTASLLLWRRLSRASVQLPLLLLGTCRPAPAREDLDLLRRDLRAQSGRMALAPLSARGVAALASRVAGGEPGPRLTHELGSADGNPLYVREALDVLSRAGALKVTGGVVELSDDADRATSGVLSLADAIADRLGYLSAESLDVLRLAALLGPTVNLNDLALVSERPPAALRPFIEESLAASILESGETRLFFRHALLRESLLRSIPGSVRVALSLTAARTLVRAGAPVERIAGLILAVPDTVDAWQVEWLRDNMAIISHRAPGIAAELIEHVLPHLDMDAPARSAMEDELAAVYFGLAHHQQVEQLTRSILQRSADGERIGRAGWLLAYTLSRTGRYEESIQVAANTASSPYVSAVWRARMAALQSMVSLNFKPMEEAGALAQAALAAGADLDDATTMAYSLHTLSLVMKFTGDSATALVHIDRALSVVQTDTQLMDLRLLLMGNRYVMLAEADRTAEALQAISDALALAERVGTPRLGVFHLHAAQHAFDTGRWDDAAAELETVTDLPDADYGVLQHGYLAVIAAHRGDRATAALHFKALQEAHDSGEGNHAFYAMLVISTRALIAELEGRPEQAVRELAVALTPDYRNSENRHYSLPALVRLALEVGDQETAREAAAAGELEADIEPIPRKRASSQWCQGLLHDDPAPVLAAAAYYRSVSYLPSLANALEDAAVLQAKAGDLKGAQACAVEAQGLYTVLGAAWESRRARSRVRSQGVHLGARGTRRRPLSGWASLTPTEARVAKFVAEGKSNPEIAVQLMLSRRTVETHVSHILSKLSVRSRRQISDLPELSVVGR